MKPTLTNGNLFGRLVGLAALIVMLSAASSYAQGTLYFGTVDDPVPTFGTINLETFELEPIADVLEPDGTFPPDNPVAPIDDAIGRFRGMTYNDNDKKLYAVIRGWVRGGDPDLLVMDTVTGQVKELLTNNIRSVISSMAWDPATNFLFTTNEVSGNTLGFMDLKQNSPVNELIGGRNSDTLRGKFYASAFDPASGILYSIGDLFSRGQQTLVQISTTTNVDDPQAVIPDEIAILDLSLPLGEVFPVAQAMTVRDGELYVVANNEGSPQSVGGPLYGGFELWKVSLDGFTAEQVNADLGRYVDAIAWVPEDIAPDPLVRPGDVNFDGEVNSGDVVQILGRNKYETNQDATWGDGDVNGGTPEGVPGFPVSGGVGPPGDGRVNSGDVIAILAANLYETGPYTVQPAQSQGDGNVVVSYDATTGGVRVDAESPITSFQVESAAGIFTGEPAHGLAGPFDVDTNAKIFKATFGDQFSELDFGLVAPTGLSESFLLDDLSAAGSFAAGGTFAGDQVELNYVPEPSTWMLCLLGVVGLAGYGWRRR